MHKAVISDFDHTLVAPPDYSIPEPVADAIRSFTAKGGIFTIASGRPVGGKLVEECKKLGLNTPLILCGGAALYSPVTEKTLYEVPLPESEAREISDFLKKDHDIVLHLGDGIASRDGLPREVFGSSIQFVKIEDADFTRILEIDVSPMMVKMTFEYAHAIKEELSAKYPDCACTIVRSHEWYGMNITSLRASKHTGVLKFMEMMNLDPEEVIGMGDGYNDYPLLSACGFKVATADAPQELKDIADLIVPPQSENGALVLFKEVLGV
jgi:Cof subfamily protein (haloacid dehalogenase superfamily)